jgi:hypothetical protein
LECDGTDPTTRVTARGTRSSIRFDIHTTKRLWSLYRRTVPSTDVPTFRQTFEHSPGNTTSWTHVRRHIHRIANSYRRHTFPYTSQHIPRNPSRLILTTTTGNTRESSVFWSLSSNASDFRRRHQVHRVFVTPIVSIV